VIRRIEFIDAFFGDVSGAGQSFNYSNGVFYQQADKSYQIVEPPPGILITPLPKGAVTVTVNSVNYREFGGVWYQPFYSGSEVIYQTVPNPTG
jgi:hypothetical protein